MGDIVLRLDIPRQIGQATRVKRKALGLTQEQVAEGAGVARSFVNRLEAGTATAVYLEKLFAVLEFLGLNLMIIGVEDAAGESVEKGTSFSNDGGFVSCAAKGKPSGEGGLRRKVGDCAIGQMPQSPSGLSSYREFIRSLEPNPSLFESRGAKGDSPMKGEANDNA